MTPSHHSTIRQDTPSVPVPRRLRRWLPDLLRDLDPVITASARASKADRYRKHFRSPLHVRMLLLHGLMGGSLRQSYGLLSSCPELLSRPADADPVVSYSQLADSSTSRPSALLAGIVPTLLARAHQQQPRADLPGDLRVLDGTFFRLSLRHAPWLELDRGAQVQVLYAPAAGTPEWIDLPENVRGNDCQALDTALVAQPERLAALRDQTLIFDLGYYSHNRFRQLLDAGIHIVTRYGQKARYEVLEDYPIQPPLLPAAGGRVTIVADQRIRLGSPNNRATPRLLDLRLVTADVLPSRKAAQRGNAVQRYQLLTDRLDLSAAEVVQSYLWRWEIELFFRWLKRTIGAFRLLGYSREAVANSVFLALMIHLITLLTSRALGFDRRSALIRAILAGLVILLAALPDDDPDSLYADRTEPFEPREQCVHRRNSAQRRSFSGRAMPLATRSDAVASQPPPHSTGLSLP
jgi:hypothetical protein